MIKIDKLNLQFGKDLKLDNGFVFKQPTVKDVVEIGEDLYFWFMMIWCRNPEDMMHFLYSIGKDFSKVTKDELFDLMILGNEELFCILLCRFSNLKQCGYFYVESEESNMIGGAFENGESIILSFDDIDAIKNFIKDIHFFKSANKRKFEDFETMGKILGYEIEERQLESKNQESGFSSIISSVVVRNNRTWDYVLELTIFRLYDELYRAMKIDEVTQLMNGVYFGTVDSTKVDKGLLNWVN